MVLLVIFALKTKNIYPDGAVSLEEMQWGFCLDTALADWITATYISSVRVFGRMS